jgi:CheY-like chemotaxis protein
MAILNLCVNARDAIDGECKLKVAVDDATVDADASIKLPPGRYIRISVADDGHGMDEATRMRAIEPFFSTKGIGKGTGLGLSMAHGLASQLGGILTIASALGRGTTVTLWLPECSPAPRAVDRLSPARERPSTRGVVLVVDDEEFIRASTTDMLAELGYKPLEADSAESALRMIDRGLRPDMLITDHLMPGMTGTKLAQAVKARLPDIGILIVSGFAEIDGVDSALPCLTKPFVQSDLVHALAALNGRS